jgi:hypothetical protein
VGLNARQFTLGAADLPRYNQLPDLLWRSAEHSSGWQTNLLDGQSGRQLWRHGHLLRRTPLRICLLLARQSARSQDRISS